MDTDTTQIEKKGMSRRAVIRNGAIGAAAFWSVPIISSLPAAAATGSTGAELPCSFAIIVYVEISGSNVDDYTYFVNGWKGNSGPGGSCGQSEFASQCSGVTTEATCLSPIEVTFDGTSSTVTITDTTNSKKLVVDVHPNAGGSGPLTTTGSPTSGCSQGVLSQNGKNFSLPSGYVFLAAISFQGCDAQYPSSQSQSLAVSCG